MYSNHLHITECDVWEDQIIILFLSKADSSLLLVMAISFLTLLTLIPGRQEGVKTTVADFRQLKLRTT